MLLRALSILFLAPPLLYLLLRGTPLELLVLLALVTAGLLYEWNTLRPGGSWREMFLLTAGGWGMLFSQFSGWEGLLPFEAGLLLFFLAVGSLWGYRPGQGASERLGWQILGMVYCILPMLQLLAIGSREQGGLLLCYLLFIIWATDIGAYLAGRALGRRKLAPLISPGKTWAGVVGGTLLGTGAGVVTAGAFSLPLGGLPGIGMALLLSLTGQTGDLLESLLKREANVKDSGALIPGHGGLLDRLDSLLLATPLFSFILFWVGRLGG